MKAIFAIGLMLIATFGAAAQARFAAVSVRSAAAPSRPAAQPLGVLASSNAGSRPLGGVALPTFPGAGIARRGGHHATTSRYVGPIYYVPNAFDTNYSGYDAYPPSEAPPSEPQRVVVNQYFVSPSYSRQESYEPTPPAEQPGNAGDPIGPTQNYYLIAYKDHTIYSALAYWVEGETLHYVTTQNTHNQASLALLDLEQTTKLNADRSVPFSIAGR